MESKEKKQYYLIKSLEKGLRVIELLTEYEDLSVTQLAKLMKTDTSASHRFLATLRELDYVEKNRDGRYQLTFKLLEQGMKVADRFEIRRIAKPFMEILSKRYRQNINLAYFDGDRLYHIDQIASRDIFKLDPGIGTEIPLHATSLGKVILSTMSQPKRDTFLDGLVLESFGPNTIIQLEPLKAEIHDVKKNGYAIDDEELALGLRCIAAPIIEAHKKARYAISISGPTFYMKKSRFDEMGEDLISICNQISIKMNQSGKVAE